MSGQEFTSAYVDGDREQDELEIAQIQLEMERLKAEEARLARKKRLEQMKKELQEQKHRVRSMKGNDIPPVTKTDDSGTKSKSLSTKHIKTNDITVKSKLKQQTSKSAVADTHFNAENLTEADKNQVTIEDLRQNSELQKQVQKELNKMGLKCVSFEERSSSEDESSQSSSEHSKKKKKHKKRKKSGINAKASDKVKDPQRWPQAHLHYEFVNKQVKFDQLNF